MTKQFQKDAASVVMRFASPSVVESADGAVNVGLATDGEREAAGGDFSLSQPALVRDALLTMHAVLASDHRFKASDRSDYLAYLLKQGKRASKELWEAQKMYLERKYAEETDSSSPPEPLLTVLEDRVLLEVFSADESAYARLELKSGSAYSASNLVLGTTHVDLGAADEALARIRRHRGATISFTRAQAAEDARTISVPYRWVRALGQMQAAATLPATQFELAPVDLYNVLFVLRTQRAKTSPRALRFELAADMPPRLVLEPWDRVIESQGPAYAGNRPGVTRTWGRRRLSFLARVLPHAKKVTVHLVGAGMPAFYVLDLGCATLTVALSGWTDAGWAGISTFDLFGSDAPAELSTRVRSEIKGRSKTAAELSEATGQPKPMVQNAALANMVGGDVIYDHSSQSYLWRPLLADPIEPAALRFRDAGEEAAHRLLAVPDQVRLTVIHDLGAEGVRIEGEVEDKKAHRTFITSFTIDRDGRTVDASCTSPQFRRAGLREGPSVPMIAIRLLYARQRAELERVRNTPEGRKLITAETRTLIRRRGGSATTMRISLSDRKVTVRWGKAAEPGRMTQQRFDTATDARDEYFRRLQDCADGGYIDTSTAEAI